MNAISNKKCYHVALNQWMLPCSSAKQRMLRSISLNDHGCRSAFLFRVMSSCLPPLSVKVALCLWNRVCLWQAAIVQQENGSALKPLTSIFLRPWLFHFKVFSINNKVSSKGNGKLWCQKKSLKLRPSLICLIKHINWFGLLSPRLSGPTNQSKKAVHRLAKVIFNLICQNEIKKKRQKGKKMTESERRRRRGKKLFGCNF